MDNLTAIYEGIVVVSIYIAAMHLGTISKTLKEIRDKLRKP